MRSAIRSLWHNNPLSSAWRAVAFLAKGRKVHPSVKILGASGKLSLAKGASVGPRTRFILGPASQVEIAEGVWIAADVEIETDGVIRIAEGTSIQRRCTINGNVVLGKECILAPNVFISSGTHPFRAEPLLSIREQERRIARGELKGGILDKPISIGDDCWLGTNVVVCPGVTIGNGAIIGANSVVTRDVPPYTVAAGSPAQKISNRLSDNED